MPTNACNLLLGNFPPALLLLHTLILENMDGNLRSLILEPILEGEHLQRDTSILHASMPALRTLRLENLSLPWTAPCFRGLRILHVEKEPLHTAPSLPVFRHMLAACPALEQLRRKNAGPLPSRAETGLAPVALSHLRELALFYISLSTATDAARAACILSQLVLPRSADINTTSFEHTPVLQQNLLSRFDISRLQDRRVVFSTAGANDGVLNLMIPMPMADAALLVPFLRLPGLRTVVLKAVDVLELGHELPGLLAKLDVQRLETLRTEGLPLAAMEKALRRAHVKGLKKLEMVDVPRPDTPWRTDFRTELKKLVVVLEVSFAGPVEQ